MFYSVARSSLDFASSCALIGMVCPNLVCTRISLWRSFKKLSREASARRRRHQNADANGKINSTRDEPLQKKFNLQTYKHHSLGDYVNTIRQFGTTDSYSTTTVGIIQTSYNLSTHRARRVNSSIAARNHGIFERIARTL